MLINVENLVRRSIKRAAKHKFHRHHKLEAAKVFKTLEDHFGKTNPADLGKADAYAQDVLGNIRYAPWLRVYSAFTGSFKEGWIPDNYYGSVVVPKLKGGYGKISNLKPLSSIIFCSATFPDLGYFVNGLFFDVNHDAIPTGALEGYLFNDTDRIVYKLDGSFQGKGVFFFDRKSFNPEAIKPLGNGVIQRFIVQHKLFDAFASSAVATLRVTSVVDDLGEVSIRACFLRLGGINDTHVHVESEICVPVDLRTGRLYNEGYLANWIAVEEHPDSRTRFSGLSIPAYSECISTVLTLHKRIPFARCIGWDLTIDADGCVQVMEWNAEHNDVKFSEATQGPCFSDLRWERLHSFHD